jgi:RNHCP domain
LNPADSRPLRLVAVPFHASGLCHTIPFLISKVLSASIVQGLSLGIRQARSIETIAPAFFGHATSTTGPGDRRCPCRSPMEPIGIEVRPSGEWAIIHRCTGCATLRTNRVAGDDREVALLALALRPLSNPAFHLDLIRPSE